MKKTNKILLKIVTFCMIFCLMFSINNPKIYADVGDFETYDYDYGSSWDNDYDYGSSWDSDYDYNYDYDYSGSSDFEIDLLLALLFSGNGKTAFILFMFMMIAAATRKSRRRKARTNVYRTMKTLTELERRTEYRNYNYRNRTSSTNFSSLDSQQPNFTTRTSSVAINNAKSVEQEIVKIDELFNREEFEAWVKQIFIKLQYAWTDRDWTEIRAFETNELFEQHNSQLERYKMKKQINVLERVAVNWVKLYKFYKTNDKEVVETLVNSKMIDYIIDEKTGEVIAGDKTTSRVKTYKLTFIRTLGVKTKPGESTLKAMNCPNCGGQLKITQAGKCEYCGSIVVVDNHGWALSELEPFTNN